MKTTILKTHGVRDGTEERSIKNWAAKHADDTLAAHKAAIPIDHPDQSVTARKIGTDAVTTDKIMNGAVTEAKIGNDAVTTNKLRNGAVTADKLGADVTEMLSDLQAIVDKEYNLTDLTGFAGGYTAAEIPLNKFVKITNDTDEELTFFQDHDEYGTALSSPIPARSSRIIIKVKNPVGGAEVENGYCIVLDGLATKQDVTNLARFVTSNQTAIATINGNDTVTGSTDKKIKDAINAFATAITEDGTVNTYAEVLSWIATHGADFAALVGQVNNNTGNISDLLPLLGDRIEIENNSLDGDIDLLVKFKGEENTSIAELRLKNSYEKSLKYPQASYLDTRARISGLTVGNYYYTNEPYMSGNRQLNYDEGVITITNPRTIPAQSSVYFRLDDLDTSDTNPYGTATIIDVIPRKDYIYFRSSANQAWTRLVKTDEISELLPTSAQIAALTWD